MPLSVLNRRRRTGAAATPAFSPSLLFASSEPGVWYDPSDVANLAWRRNLLTYSEQFDNAAWTKFRSAVTANTGTDPLGGATADKLVPSASLTAGQMYNATPLSTISGASYAGSVYVKAAELGFAFVSNNARGSSTQAGVCVNLATGARSNEGANGTYTVTDAGNGWWRVSIVASATNTNGYLEVHPLAAAGVNGSYLGDGTSGILIWGAQLELGTVATAYQRITDVNTEVVERFPTATLFQDTAGTTPVTTPGQTVALMLDKSKGLTLGSELVTNGTFDANSSTGWTLNSWSVASDRLEKAAGDSLRASGTLSSTLVSGRTYQITLNAIGFTSACNALFRTGIGGTASNGYAIPAGTSSHTFVLQAADAHTVIQFHPGTSSFAGSIDNISVKELAGNHAVQATAASRPTYGVVPLGGRRNLLTWSEGFDNAVWVKTGATVTANAATAPDATLAADRLTETSAAGEHFTSQQLAKVGASTTYTQSCYFKADAGSRNFGLGITDGTTGGYAAIFSTSGSVVASSQVVGSVLGWTFISSSVVAAGDGWMRASITATTNTATRVDGVCYLADGSSRVYLGNGASSLFIWGAQLELGSTATAYQRVSTAFDVTEAGVQSLSYLAFDGVDDWMVTPTITPGIDKAQVFAGVRKLSDAARGVVAELGTGGALGSFGIEAPTTAAANYGSSWRGSTTTLFVSSASSFIAPITNVLAGIGDISGDIATLSVNGTQVAQSTADQGTGNFLAYPLYIGRRAGTSIPFNGNIYSMIVRFGANLTTTQIQSTETYINSKTGAY